MPSIDLNKGIEGVLPLYDANQVARLPKTRYVPPDGGRVKEHLDFYFTQHKPIRDQLLKELKPNLESLQVTAPYFYIRYLHTAAERIRQYLGQQTGDEEAVNQTENTDTPPKVEAVEGKGQESGSESRRQRRLQRRKRATKAAAEPSAEAPVNEGDKSAQNDKGYLTEATPEQQLAAALAILDNVDEDMVLLNSYISCLQKV